MKQPFFLRRLNRLTVVIFLTWCLSPLGSSALQRAYDKVQLSQEGDGQFYYMNTTNFNPMFSVNAPVPDFGTQQDTNRSLNYLLMAEYFNGIFLPFSEEKSANYNPDADDFGKPLIQYPNQTAPSEAIQSHLTISSPSFFGIPIFVPIANDPSPPKKVKSPNTQDVFSDIFEFQLQSSYFNFTCEPWQIMQQGSEDLLQFNWEPAYQFGTLMGGPPTSSEQIVNYIAFVSQNRVPSYTGFNSSANSNAANASIIDSNPAPWEQSSSGGDFSWIGCRYDRVFVNQTLDCSRISTNNYLPNCFSSSTELDKVAILSDPANVNYTLQDFDYEWMLYGSGATIPSKMVSPMEQFLFNAGDASLLSDEATSSMFNFTAGAAPGFQYRLEQLFNSWVTLGYWPQGPQWPSSYTTPQDPHDSTSTNLTLTDRFHNASLETSWQYFSYETYQIVPVWLTIYMVSAGILLLVGIAAMIIEAWCVAPDVLGYASNVARNSRHLKLPPTATNMKGSERLKAVKDTVVMMQDVSKEGAQIGKIALGNKKDGSRRLEPNRVYM
jgi:hypothetical protein